MASDSKQLERQTGDLAQERPRSADGHGEKNGESLSFEEAKKAEGVAQSQQALMRQAESLKQSMEALQRSAAAAGLGDTAWQRELSEIRDQLDRALSPELRERLQELQQALKDLDADRTRRRSSGWPNSRRRPARPSNGAASCSSGRRSRATSPT